MKTMSLYLQVARTLVCLMKYKTGSVRLIGHLYLIAGPFDKNILP